MRKFITAAIMAATFAVAPAAYAPAAYALDAGVGLGVVSAATQGGALSGGGVAGGGILIGTATIQATQTAASTGAAGAQFMVTPLGITALTQQSSAAVSQQTLTFSQIGLNGVVGGGGSSAGNWNNANAWGIGVQGYLNF